MKLRFHDGSLRLRLSRGEADQLASMGQVDESIAFPDGKALRYSIESGDQAKIEASFDGSSIHVTVPRASVRRWIESEEPGMAGSTGPLGILIEKDYQCLHRESAEDRDSFPNPLGAKG